MFKKEVGHLYNKFNWEIFLRRREGLRWLGGVRIIRFRDAFG